MYFLYQTMAIYWTLTEGVILLILRWGFLVILKGDGRQKNFIIFATLSFALLATLMYGGESVIQEYVNLNEPSNLTAYRWSLINFFCTIWVILEGIIMLYIYRIYITLKPAINGGDTQPKAMSFKWISLFILILIGLYSFYHLNLLYVIENPRLTPKGIYHISVFYIRICGVFWIIFEWVIAVIVIKTFSLFKNKEAWE